MHRQLADVQTDFVQIWHDFMGWVGGKEKLRSDSLKPKLLAVHARSHCLSNVHQDAEVDQRIRRHLFHATQCEESCVMRLNYIIVCQVKTAEL